VLEWLRAHGKGYQTLINQVLRAWYDAQIGRAARKGRRGPEGGGKERSEKNRCQVISEKGRSQARRASPMRLRTDAAFFEDREGSRWATVNLNGHPRGGASEGKEVWKCADRTRHIRDKP